MGILLLIALGVIVVASGTKKGAGPGGGGGAQPPSVPPYGTPGGYPVPGTGTAHQIIYTSPSYPTGIIYTWTPDAGMPPETVSSIDTSLSMGPVSSNTTGRDFASALSTMATIIAASGWKNGEYVLRLHAKDTYEENNG